MDGDPSRTPIGTLLANPFSQQGAANDHADLHEAEPLFAELKPQLSPSAIGQVTPGSGGRPALRNQKARTDSAEPARIGRRCGDQSRHCSDDRIHERRALSIRSTRTSHQPLAWMKAAACANTVKPDIFTEPGHLGQALAYCRRRPVLADCFAFTARLVGFHGVAAGRLWPRRRKLPSP